MNDLNTGHGHVWTRPDGVKARCGGPSMCRECQRDQTAWLKMNPPAKGPYPAPPSFTVAAPLTEDDVRRIVREELERHFANQPSSNNP